MCFELLTKCRNLVTSQGFLAFPLSTCKLYQHTKHTSRVFFLPLKSYFLTLHFTPPGRYALSFLIFVFEIFSVLGIN